MFKVGIIGAGWIAEKMAEALAPLEDYCIYAIASRSIGKATEFAGRWNIPKAYGSYEDMVKDNDVDLVYIATPHSHHFPHAMLALNAGKPVLVEKAFTANAAEAEELIETARSKGLFITEAIWTRYMPLSHKVKEIMESGIIGKPRVITATLCYMMEFKERILRPDLCGGALLDLGVYALNFARMYFGTDIVRTVSNCHMGPTGIDLQECISLSYADGKMANLQAGTLCLNDRQGIINGTEGYIRVDNINCPEVVEVYRNYELVERYVKPEDMVNGYEYQVIEARRCIEAGLPESPMMPHQETLDIMKQMDGLRKEWGVVYPMDR
ncbi:MAG: Gfo/Idh/MocA family oxidoreductase [Bacteroidales bacterium]|nr:Gfo/Idh/MocA family oxidoreductase [Bacteroidales bacterium]MBQ9723098.1 Gfo/Idh/MocA family oxidoreductase [Bacteroidales bacterium]